MMAASTAFATLAAGALERAQVGDHTLSVFLRQALTPLGHWALPLGWTDERDAWVLAMPKKLDSPNRHRAHWSVLNSARATWERLIWATVAKTRGCASATWLKEMGRAPQCGQHMAVQVIRLVPSVRQFIKDDDNRAYSAKPVHDSLKRVGLIKEDRREWLTASTIVQDVSPFAVPITVVILWPKQADLFSAPGGSDVQRRHAVALHRGDLQDRDARGGHDGGDSREPGPRQPHARARTRFIG